MRRLPTRLRNKINKYSGINLISHHHTLGRLLMNKDHEEIIDLDTDIILSKEEEKLIEKLDKGSVLLEQEAEAIRVLFRYYQLSQANIYSQMAVSLRQKAKKLMSQHTNDAMKQSKIMKAMADCGKAINNLENMAAGHDEKKINLKDMGIHELRNQLKDKK